MIFLQVIHPEEWYLLVINKDEDGLLFSAWMIFNCNVYIVTQRLIPTGLLSDGPSFQKSLLKASPSWVG